MKLALVLLVLVLGSFAQQIPTDACSLCSLVVDGLEGLAAQKVSKDALLQQLTTAQSQICSRIPAGNTILSPEQCSSYIRLYGPYVIDLLLSTVQPGQVCSTIGLCDQSALQYDIVLPVITDYSVEYDRTDTIALGDIKRYKIFLGSPAFANQELLAVSVVKSSKDACGLTMEVSNKTSYNYTAVCAPGKIECLDRISNPGRGVWYYVSVSSSIAGCDYKFQSSVRNAPIIVVETFSRPLNALGWIIFLGVPVLFFTLTFCCCFCCVKRRTCKRMCKMQEVENQQSKINVELMETATPAPMNAPVGYFYVPVGPGQYMQVPQQMVYPQAYPISQE
jgi:hypothetical protein